MGRIHPDDDVYIERASVAEHDRARREWIAFAVVGLINKEDAVSRVMIRRRVQELLRCREADVIQSPPVSPTTSGATGELGRYASRELIEECHRRLSAPRTGDCANIRTQTGIALSRLYQALDGLLIGRYSH